MKVAATDVVAKDGRHYTVRSARPAEAGAILDLAWLIHSADSDTTILDPDEFRLTAEQMSAKVRGYAEQENSVFLVAVAAEEIIGTLTIRGGRDRKLRHTGELGLNVHPRWRRVGVGARLLAAGVAAPSLKRVTLCVFASNAPAIALYRGFGFREEGRRRGQIRIGDDYVDEILMALDVG